MRKLFNLFAAALVMLAAASCEKNEVLPGNNSEGKVVTLKASINNGGTKTSLEGEKGSDGKYPVLWSEGDQIAVVQRLSGEGMRIFQFTLSEGKNTANGTFTCNSAGNFDPSELFEALYPYNAIENLVIPQNQNYAEESFGQGAMIMYAKNTNGGNSLVFDNTLGVLKLTLKGVADEEVSSIELNASAPICGNAEIIGNLGESKRLAINTESASFYANNIILRCPNIPIEEYEDFLIALPQGNYNFSVTINTNKGVYYKSTTDKTVTASNILKMAELNLEGFANKMSYVENGVYLGEGVSLSVGSGKTIIWAPVNCGYEPADGEYKGYPYGKLYQWGRKYGQGYNSTYDATTPEIYIGRVTLDFGQSESNMNVLFRNFMDWLSSPDDKLWNSGTEGSPVKTDYDPCPNGWRVPTKGELSNLCQNRSSWTTNAAGQQGFWFSGATSYTQEVPQVFFPAAGYHHYLADPGQGRNVNGDYWSSIANQGDETAYNLTIEKGDDIVSFDRAIITAGDFRANGYSVRCVKDTPQSEPMPSGN